MAELDAWKELAAIARGMAATAEAHDWDSLVERNARFQTTLERLGATVSRPLPEHERREKAALIRSILADYEIVRSHVGPWMADVKPMLDAWAPTETPA